MSRKYCVVPMCTNSSVKTPEKLFFCVPTGNIRKQWWKVMKRADTIKNNTCVYCCEDHFDLENDMENYIKFKLVGGIKKLKKHVVPHKFACRKPQVEVKERSAVKKRRNIELINKILNDDLPPRLTREEVFVDEFTPHKNVNEDPLESLEVNYKNNSENTDSVKMCTKKIQVSIQNKTCNKSTMTEERFFTKPPRRNRKGRRKLKN